MRPALGKVLGPFFCLMGRWLDKQECQFIRQAYGSLKCLEDVFASIVMTRRNFCIQLASSESTKYCIVVRVPSQNHLPRKL